MIEWSVWISKYLLATCIWCPNLNPHIPHSFSAPSLDNLQCALSKKTYPAFWDRHHPPSWIGFWTVAKLPFHYSPSTSPSICSWTLTSDWTCSLTWTSFSTWTASWVCSLILTWISSLIWTSAILPSLTNFCSYSCWYHNPWLAWSPCHSFHSPGTSSIFSPCPPWAEYTI